MSKRGASRRRPATPVKDAAGTRRILSKLFAQHPGADTELHFTNAYELLVATILSAQCTDERVNQVTPGLYQRYPDARALAQASTAALEPQIQSTGFFRAKSRSLVGMAMAVVERHDGEIPRTMEELIALPGVGRKTANVVLGHALGVPGLPVDRHVLRVSNRIGIARSDDPVIVEQQLCAAMPPSDWTRTSDTLILHGRRVCRPRPACDRCAVRSECVYFATVVGFGLADARGQESRLRKGRRRATPGEPGAGAAGPRNSGQAVRLKPDTTETPRPTQARGPGRESGAPSKRSEGRRSGGERSGTRTARPGRESGAPSKRSEGRRSGGERRAPEARGTGRGGGAPRQTKK